MTHWNSLRRLIVGSLALLLATTGTPAQAAPTLEQVAAHLKALDSLTADFTQIADTGAVAKGRMTLARPGKIRFDYEPKSPLLVVSDGRTLSMVDYDVAQVSRWPVKETPLALLLDPDSTLKTRARLAPADQTPRGYVAVVGQDPKRPEYGAITLYFAQSAQGPAGLLLSGWRVLDGQGRTTTVQLTNVTINPPVSKTAFTFRDPRGAPTARPGKLR